MDGSESSYVFISHKCKDHDVVYGIVRQLEALGVRCWIDERDILVGSDWYDEIRVMRHGAAAVIWIKSPASASSDQVLKELKLAQRRSQLIIPLEIGAVADWEPEWEDFVFLQAFRFEDPRWEDRVAQRLFALGGFAPTPLTESVGDGVVPSVTLSSLAAKSSAHAGRVELGGEHCPFAIVSNDGRTYQLDGLSGLGETLVETGDLFTTGDSGIVAVSSDASVIATSNVAGEVELWTLGAADAMRGPVLPAVLPGGATAPRMLAVDRPLGQAIRIIACGNNSAYSLMQRVSGEWSAMSLIEGDEPIVSGAVVKDDVLCVRASGTTVWASTASKRPFSLPKLRGVDAAAGADGRYYLVGWGNGPDGASVVEVVVEADRGWERIHRGPGRRAGIVRAVPDIVRQTRGTEPTAIAIEHGEHSVAILPLP